MAYTKPSISAYNTSPPADDGSETEANKVKWSTIKTKITDPVKVLAEAINDATETAFNDLASTATDDGTKGFHLVSYPPLSGETGIENHAFARNNVLRFIPVNLHAGMRAGTNTTDLATYMQNGIDSIIAQGGGNLKFPASAYRYNTGLTCNPEGSWGKEVILEGDGVDTRLEPVLSSGYALECRGGSGTESKVKLKGMYFNGDLCSGTASAVLMHRNFNSSGATDLVIINFPQYGLHISENWNMNFYNINIRDCDKAIYMYADNTNGDVLTGNINQINFYGGSIASNDYGMDIGDATYTTTYSGAGTYAFQNIGLFGVNISNTTRGIRGYFTSGLNIQSPYLEAGSGYVAATHIHIELFDSHGLIVNRPYLSNGRSYLKLNNSLACEFTGFSSQTALVAGEEMFVINDSELTLRNGRVASSGSVGDFIKYTQTSGNNVKILLENINNAGGFANVVNETIASQLNVRVGITHCKSLGVSDFSSTLTRIWGITENGAADFSGESAGKYLRIQDGINAPGTVSGEAQIYVDSADGDLKVKFGDGVTKTIVTDT